MIIKKCLYSYILLQLGESLAKLTDIQKLVHLVENFPSVFGIVLKGENQQLALRKHSEPVLDVHRIHS